MVHYMGCPQGDKIFQVFENLLTMHNRMDKIKHTGYIAPMQQAEYCGES